jgi:hypothetical protein
MEHSEAKLQAMTLLLKRIVENGTAQWFSVHRCSYRDRATGDFVTTLSGSQKYFSDESSPSITLSVRLA